ncbi:T9SS type A sorting domain-containing protein [Polaribacter haliotis]|uniref:T9SS type A sorting domain-containing protein n=1 Tax=Polaribacter haliotis TaxID=1888915 RepID=A0A7L8ABJ6_9FLAO|nr:MBG domain-containing protein [Polaribacter haliotis]QOD59388.1 T9SS type A sorting domain-containing protein [Polaribacter haliotis]
MKTRKLNFFFAVFLGFFLQFVNAQDPNWTVNSADYQYSMTFTTFLNVNGTTLTSTNDKIGAFVNGEIRGVSNVVFVPNANKYVAYLSVFANTDYETINFKIYDSNSDKVVNIDNTETFSIDGNLGGIFQSYSIANPQLNANAVLNSFNFDGINTLVSTISQDEVHIVLPENTSISNLKAVFNSSGNSKVYVDGILQESGVSLQDFTNPITYSVLSENEANLNKYVVSVAVAKNTDPVNVVVSTTDNLNTNTVPVSLDVAFSKAVAGFEKSDFLLENCTISSFLTSDYKNYKIEVVPFSQGKFSVQVPENVSLDLNNNQNTVSNKIGFNYDISKPIIQDISKQSNVDSWWFLVTFNEEVKNVDLSDFELNGLASSNITISNVENLSNNQYKVSISAKNTDLGVVSLGLKNSNNITDLVGNSLVEIKHESYFLTKRKLTITADFKTKIYGEEDPELTYKITSGSLVNGDVISGSLTRPIGENIGTYAITSNLNNDNYEITFIANNLTILYREITVTADLKTKIYGDEDPELTYKMTSGNLVDGDVLSGSLVRVVGENIGEYAITSTLNNDNYEITFIADNLTILKRQITVTVDSKSKNYGDEDPALTYNITSGSLVDGDVLSGSLVRAIGENIGEYAITSTINNDNYEIAFIASDLTITKREITISADIKTKIIGNTDPVLTYRITKGNLVDGDVLIGNLSREAGESLGDYLISSSLSNSNYNITFQSGFLRITAKKGIVITVDSKTKIYGETDPILTYKITSGSLDSGDVLTGSLSRTIGENAGEYVISSNLSNTDYDIIYVSGKLTIAKRKLSITADAKTKIYGESDPEFTYNISSGSLINGDVLSGILNRESGENVGVYKISSTLVNSNYEITFIGSNFIISKKEISITADAKTKIYGESDPEFTYNISSGSLINGDVLSGTLNRELGENVGVYKILSTLVNSNYEITFIGSNFTISKKEISINSDFKTKIYGDSDPDFTYKITSGNLLNGDVLSGTLKREVGENIGDYEISSTLENGNYQINFISSFLTISKREITVTADSIIKGKNDADPPLTYQITNGILVNKDVFTGNLTRELGEEIGAYLIKIGSLSLNNNYELFFIGANFEISTTANINDEILNTEVKLYPNPATYQLSIKGSSQLEIDKIIAYNLLGKTVFKLLKPKNTIQIGHLQRGVYLFKIFTNNGVVIKRIVKK